MTAPGATNRRATLSEVALHQAKAGSYGFAQDGHLVLGRPVRATLERPPAAL